MPTNRVQRRLAAILAADVAGYSRLMGEDEEGTLAALTAHRTDLIEPCIAEHRGRLVKTTGDGLLVEFPSVVDAVRCAVAFQDGIRERNADTPENRRIEFRIGVNLGDVIVQDDDVYGEGVNVAARLEGSAERGGIVLSADVWRQVRGKVDHSFTDLGERKFKNIAEPVHAYLVDLGIGRSTKASGLPIGPDAVLNRPAVAVLPFDNLSDQPGQDYFADGLTEDLITALSLRKSFPVIARNSTFAFKNKIPDVRDVGKTLDARYVIEGSLRKAGERVRITAQLIDAETGHHVWAERYDRQFADIFDLQDEMTEAIVNAVVPELQIAERERAKRKPPQNLDTWELFQRGLWHYYRGTKDDFIEARELFKRASELDPEFAEPHALLALMGVVEVLYGYSQSPSETLTQSAQSAQRAVQLDDRNALGHFVLCRVYSSSGKHEMAIAEGEKAVAINPSLAFAHHGLAMALLWANKAEDAVVSFDNAIRLSPVRRQNIWDC